MTIKIAEEFKNIADQIEAWKKTPEAMNPARVYVAEKTKMTEEKIEKMYPSS